MQTQAASVSLPKQKTKNRRSRAELQAINELKAEYQQVLEGFKRAECDLQNATANFEYVSEPKAVDACVYRIQYSRSRCDNLLKQLKAVKQRIENIDSTFR